MLTQAMIWYGLTARMWLPTVMRVAAEKKGNCRRSVGTFLSQQALRLEVKQFFHVDLARHLWADPTHVEFVQVQTSG